MILELLFILNITYCLLTFGVLYILPGVIIYMMPLVKYRTFAKKKCGTRRFVVSLFANGLLTHKGQHIVVTQQLTRRALELSIYSTTEMQLLNLIDHATNTDSHVLDYARLGESISLHTLFGSTLFDNADKCRLTEKHVDDDTNAIYIGHLTDALFEIIWTTKRKKLIGKYY